MEKNEEKVETEEKVEMEEMVGEEVVAGVVAMEVVEDAVSNTIQFKRPSTRHPAQTPTRQSAAPPTARLVEHP